MASDSAKHKAALKKRAQKKASKAAKREAEAAKEVEKSSALPEASASLTTTATGDGGDVEVEYTVANPFDESDPNFEEWQNVFKFFNPDDDKADGGIEGTDGMDVDGGDVAAKDGDKGSDDSDGDNSDVEELSKKKKKLANRLSIAELKQLVKRPDVVEVWDVTSADPKLLVYLKAYRNAVPVPRHWCNKRKYLQGKRGVEKTPFQLPSFIEHTGIAKLREAYQEKEDAKTLKQKNRDRMAPKMNKMDIDYQVLHDAFFRFQTKPKLVGHGDVYWEGKEFEVNLSEQRPGMLSQELKRMLGIPEGGPPVPPPWLINMQRYGPPPSYPTLKIPGLNAPIPPGAQFGYHPGGWGKPPVDEFGRPVYGNVFESVDLAEEEALRASIDRKLWGELESDEEVEEEEEEEEEEEAEGEDAEMGQDDIASGISSTTSGLETPGTVDPRKSGLETPDSIAMDIRKPKQLYQVLEEKDAGVGGGLMGSDHTYVIPGAGGDGAGAGAGAAKGQRVNVGKGKVADGVEVAIDPAELEGLDAEAIQAKYDAKIAAAKASKEDVSDVFLEGSRKAAKKRKSGTKETKSKKTKWF